MEKKELLKDNVLKEKIEKSRKEIKEGKCVKVATKEELKAFLDSI